MIQMINASSTGGHMATSCLVQHVNQRASRIATFDDVFCSCTPHTCDRQPFGNMHCTKRHQFAKIPRLVAKIGFFLTNISVNDGARHQLLEALHGSRKGFSRKRLAFFAGLLCTQFTIVKAGKACSFLRTTSSASKASSLRDLREGCHST
jgi:hypothetical protein